jgi:hypothetical protein
MQAGRTKDVGGPRLENSGLQSQIMTDRFASNLACLFHETRKRFQKGQNSGKVSWVRNPARVVSVSWKVSTVEERRQDRRCLSRRGDCRTNGHNPEKVPWVRVPVKISVARKLSAIEE